MTPFDFDSRVDRSGMGSAKWIRRTDREKAAGIVPMSVADMEFVTAPCVRKAVERAAGHGVFGYTDADAAYFDAVTGWMRSRHGWDVRVEWIVPLHGVVPGMSVAVRAFTEPGDRVLIQAPGYDPFRIAVADNGREPVFNPLFLGEDGLYHMDLDHLRQQAADPRARLMFLCSPHNPVGRLWSPEELRALAQICLECDVLVISDEIHSDLELHGKHTVFSMAAPEMANRCAMLTAPSKTFNLAGLQTANAIIPSEALRERFRRRACADGQSPTNVSYFGYHALIAAYNEGGPWLDALLDYVRGNFTYLGEWLRDTLPAIRLLPSQGTYLAWTDWRGLGLSWPECMRFAREEAMLIFSDGEMFGEGGEGFMRINLALPRQELALGLERLAKAARARGLA